MGEPGTPARPAAAFPAGPALARIRGPLLFAAALLAIGLTARFATVFTESINWDEFAVMARADRAARLGDLAVGGRPGLMTLALVPFVRDCVNSVTTVVHARIAWQLINLLYLTGLFALVVRWHRRAGERGSGVPEGLFAVLLVAFLPVFVTWSVQVRADQAALAAAIWGGFMLLSRSNWSTLASGGLFGVAILFSQKGVYTAAAAVTLLFTAAMGRVMAQQADWKAELRASVKACALAAITCTATLALYFLLVPEASHVATPGAVTSSWDQMAWVREKLGFRAYRAQAPGMPVHWLLFATLIIATARAAGSGCREAVPVLATSWLMLLLGSLVAFVHGAGFAYFLMTVALFAGLALAPMATRLAAAVPSMPGAVLAMLAVVLFIGAAPATLQMLHGSQVHQRRTMDFINTTSLSGRRGFQTEGALFCTGDPDPLPVIFSHQIARRLQGNPQAIESFLAEFRSRPIAYIVESYRMNEFPPEVRQFWSAHYLRHSGPLLVLGSSVGGQDAAAAIEILAAGQYRWTPGTRDSRAALRIGATTIEPGGSAALTPGLHRVETDPTGMAGTLSLDLPAWPQEDLIPFYDERQLHLIAGRQ